MTESSPSAANDHADAGHEPDVVNARLLVLSGAGLVALLALALLLVYGIIHLLARENQYTTTPPVVQPERIATGPQVTPDQPQLLHELRETEQERLTSYAWIDRQEGIARIPIDRAMKILSEQGLPAQAPAAKETDEDQPK